MNKLKLSLADAKSQAEQLLHHLRPACQRIQIAGSIRRQSPYVGDIELVAIPHILPPQTDLFGHQVPRTFTRLDLILEDLVGQGLLSPPAKKGPRFKQYAVAPYEVGLDLFITDPERWGMIYTIRTGSADFSRWLVTSRLHGGALPVGYRARDGLLWNQGHPQATPEERDVFQALGLPWRDPPDRTRGLWNGEG